MKGIEILFFASALMANAGVAYESAITRSSESDGASMTLPVLHIDTEDNAPIVSKVEYLDGTYYSEDKTSTEWENYIDVVSIARYFIVQEVIDNPDGFHGSFYLHKDAGAESKWVAGPLWDPTCYNREKTDYTFRLPVHYAFTPHWISEIIQYPHFCEAVAQGWAEFYPDKVEVLMDYIDEVLEPLGEAEWTSSKRWLGMVRCKQSHLSHKIIP